MADVRQIAEGSAPGPWFVDTSCMGCDASRQCAPELFVETPGGGTRVARQPSTPEERIAATRALLSCPTSSIGVKGEPLDVSVFPHEIEANSGVFLTGFNSIKAYGGNAWFVRRPEGNLLIDGPRFTSHLVKRFREWGGIAHILLTHRDDVGDAAQYAAEFGSRVWVHPADGAAAPFATDRFTHEPNTAFDDALRVLPMPGHTRGSVMFLLHNRFLFTGDSLFWSRTFNTLHAHRAQCWFSWPTQRESLAQLTRERFEWVLPGHGSRKHLAHEAMQHALGDLLRRMPTPDWVDGW